MAGLLAALLLVLPASAGAAEVTRSGDVVLDARDEGASLCLRVPAAQSCGPAPVRPYRTLVVTSARAVAGAVPAAAARVEVELAGGRRVPVDTVGPGAYSGRLAQRVRFFLLPEPGGRVVVVRVLDASGALIGAVAAGDDGAVRLAREEVLAQRRGGRSIVVRAVRERIFAPTPAALDRFEERTCLAVRARAGMSSGGTGTCLPAGPYRPRLELAVETGCGPLRSVVYGFVAETAARVELRLGSGRRLLVPARPLPAGYPAPARFVAAVLPRGEAVRSAAVDGSGQRLRERPGGLPCVPKSGSAVQLYGHAGGRGASLPEGAGREVAVLDGHRLLVREAEEERVCLGIDRLRADGGDCLLPPVDPGHAHLTRRAGLVAAVLPAEVTRARLPGGGEVETIPHGPHLRLLFARADEGRVRFLDASGASVGSAASGTLPPDAGPVTLLRGSGWRLRAWRYGRFWCAGLTDDCTIAPTGFGGAFVAVGCGARRPVLHGSLPSGARTAAVRLRGGRLVAARVVRVPGGGRAYAVELPRRAAVAALRFGAREVRFPLPAAAEQCGYVLFEPALSV